MKNYIFKPICIDSIDIEEYHSFPNKSVLTTLEWLRFIQEDSQITPYIVKIEDGSKGLVGYFTGGIIKKFGVKILGSPFPGWSTPYMGLDVVDSSKKGQILCELIPFVLEDSKCWYLQIIDRDFDRSELEAFKSQMGFQLFSSETLELKIEENDELQYKRMHTSCRNFINQFTRRGASIEVATPNDDFAEEYYDQLCDVFAKQDLVPTYTVDKVKCLLKHLSSTDSVLCLRVRDPEGKSIATSIFPAFNKKMFFWGGASYRESQHFRPNEYMIYRAIHYWRERGCTLFDMVGNRKYKLKFGSELVTYPAVVVTKYSFLIPLKNIASRLYYFSGKLLWKLKIKR